MTEKPEGQRFYKGYDFRDIHVREKFEAGWFIPGFCISAATVDAFCPTCNSGAEVFSNLYRRPGETKVRMMQICNNCKNAWKVVE